MDVDADFSGAELLALVVSGGERVLDGQALRDSRAFWRSLP